MVLYHRCSAKEEAACCCGNAECAGPETCPKHQEDGGGHDHEHDENDHEHDGNDHE